MASIPLPKNPIDISNVKLLATDFDKNFYYSKFLDSSAKETDKKNKISQILSKIETNFGIKAEYRSNHLIRKSGIYGDVYFGKDNYGKKYVIKIFRDDCTGRDSMSEISCLSTLSASFGFPKLYSIVELNNGEYMAIIINYCGKKLSEKTLAKHNREYLAIQFISAYNTLYQHKILHRDIKTDNICISDSGILTIIDFGYSLQAPYVTNQMEVVGVNAHTESLIGNYNIGYSHQIDLLGIYNSLAYIFNAKEKSHHPHIYPFSIIQMETQLNNIIYLLLSNNNTESNRVKIYNIFFKKKIFSDDFTLGSFHLRYAENDTNRQNYQIYQKIKQNIPLPIYRAMKKILNPNPRTRITFLKFFEMISKYYVFLQKPINLIPRINFNDDGIFSCNMRYSKYLIKELDKKYPTTIYSISYYKFFQFKDYISKNKDIPFEEEILLDHIIYIHYNTQYESIYPLTIQLFFSTNLFMRYLKTTGYDLFGKTPYNFIDHMQLFKWTKIRKILFDYFLTILATNDIFIQLDPFVLCIVITILIYRLSVKIPIQIDMVTEIIDLPVGAIEPFILKKDNVKILLENNKFMKLINKTFGFYAKLNKEQKLLKLNTYYKNSANRFFEVLGFYANQVKKI